ncbi:hypothetical protein OIE66_16480 [Nonomuraea sp. NBC_01738]|uniref:hypothetical protein n=1 Tax=Nonomuraea sp. NBC_01738 TaxID=2976003 RepID=UPI002E132BBE|nr:hypothetical protein OIE66_16480 [Nonomuraea sp. NBC_01738]
MKPFARLRADLAAGRNLEIYVTALIALAVGVLGVVGAVDFRIVSAATLATLALLAVTALGPRQRADELKEQVGRLNQLVQEKIAGTVAADAFLTTTRPGLEEQVTHAHDIRLCGVTLSRTVRNLVGDLEERLLHGASVRILLIDSEPGVLDQAAKRSTISGHPEVFAHRVRATMDMLHHLGTLPGSTGTLEVRLMPFVPAFGVVLIDPGTDDGVLHVELGTHSSARPDPVFTLTAGRDPRWFRHFTGEFDRMWEASRPAGARGAD